MWEHSIWQNGLGSHNHQMKTELGTVLKFRTFHGTPNSPKDSKQQLPKVTENSKCPRNSFRQITYDGIPYHVWNSRAADPLLVLLSKKKTYKYTPQIVLSKLDFHLCGLGCPMWNRTEVSKQAQSQIMLRNLCKTTWINPTVQSGSSFVPSLLVDTPLPTSAHPLLSTPVPAMRHEQHKKPN
jgi:hypothetical protein